MASSQAFTGRSRDRRTRSTVRFADTASRLLITVGGIGTIVAVLGVSLFLIWKIWPLFVPADISQGQAVQAPWQTRPLHVAEDEYRVIGWALDAEGVARTFRIDDGRVVHEQALFDQRTIASTSFLIGHPLAAFGFEDGTLQLANIRFDTSFLINDPADADRNEVPDSLRRTLNDSPDRPADFREGVVQLTTQGDYRYQRLDVQMLRSEQVTDKPIVLLDHVLVGNDPLVVVVSGDEQSGYTLQRIRGSERENFMTGEREMVFEQATPLPFEAPHPGEPIALAVSGPGNDVYVAWPDGAFIRVRLPGAGRQPFVAEKGRLVDEGKSLVTVGFIIGNTTLIWGDSAGGVFGGFPVRVEELADNGLESYQVDSQLHDSARFAVCRIKTLAAAGPTLRSYSPSPRSRLVACGFDNGEVRLFNMTNEGTVATVTLPESDPVLALTVSPKEDGFLASTARGMFDYHFEAPFHEVNVKALLGRVWYEGYEGPGFTYQSSAGHTGAEPKYSLVPLIFGTLKATFYSMLFGAPLAVLAAIYSSEFLRPRVKGAIKPTIELMASLPSVVLGFLAGLVFAPFLEDIVPATLAVFFTIPLALLIFAYVWQLLPQPLTLRMGGWRLGFMVLPLAVAYFGAMAVGPWLEDTLFAGDIRRWLAWGPNVPGAETQPQFRSAAGGWIILLLPICAVVMAMLFNRYVSPWLRSLSSRYDRLAMAGMDVLRFAVWCVLSVGLAVVLGTLLNAVGADPRATWGFWGFNFSPVDTYVQRNSLVVGVVMGFAIIPIIYTIADDALSSVPEHLRSGSLGAGATPWQTAVRIIIPTAMSGIFSALMIGLGRAVGETMIVLMASGGTPILDLNIFSGFRTLSQNIANELPEAPKDGTHFRTLFLNALVLFAMTFLVNTVAEAVRLRFRKRAYQL